MLESEYIPTGPYFIRSGKRTGKSLEEFMFKDYCWLVFMKNRMDASLKPGSKQNAMHAHLLWLLERGENRVAPPLCPYCREKNISFFAYSYKENKYYTCCDKWHPCIGQMLSKADKHPLKFSSIARFQYGSRPYISAFLKSVFFPGRENLTAVQLFEFFSVPSPGK